MRVGMMRVVYRVLGGARGRRGIGCGLGLGGLDLR